MARLSVSKKGVAYTIVLFFLMDANNSSGMHVHGCSLKQDSLVARRILHEFIEERPRPLHTITVVGSTGHRHDNLPGHAAKVKQELAPEIRNYTGEGISDMTYNVSPRLQFIIT